GRKHRRVCYLPLTSARPVDLIVTDLAVFGVGDSELILKEVAAGISVAQVRQQTEAAFSIADTVVETQPSD
ncbi:MAG: succinyl-CoA--3-ketoacid-CoA transferase, partial [Bacteroidota bacterium]